MTQFLRRYTDIPALIYLLRQQKITLLDPRTWDDKNDTHYLSLYKRRKSLKSVLCLCFTEAPETFHHWRVYANGSSGVCIRFDRAKLIKALAKHDLRPKPVRYLTMVNMRKRSLRSSLRLEELPFLKRVGYIDESEVRVVYESRSIKKTSIDVAIPLSCIDRIILSPSIHLALKREIKKMINGIDQCKTLEVVRSTLISNKEWKNHGEKAS